ncbi:hypothetical protein F4821DRAFT_71539 [Hypoxylon rubiginosum]|uniref:Uncharacterized protein n=1 Tax=Hypoxylon rubiginosum TaxID=110542 RepID=A0ACC0D8Q0_9PEZI|nr:hypothetical protein F4821DRAFT_71539 [Hypoxylon rubiginosum]
MQTGSLNILRPAEAELVNSILKNSAPGLKGTVDWNAVMRDSGHKNRNVTLTRFLMLCKKHNWCQADTSAPGPRAEENTASNHSEAPPTPKSSPKKRKRNVKVEEDEEY